MRWLLNLFRAADVEFHFEQNETGHWRWFAHRRDRAHDHEFAQGSIHGYSSLKEAEQCASRVIRHDKAECHFHRWVNGSLVEAHRGQFDI